MRLPLLIALLGLPPVAGCTQFPDLDGSVPPVAESADFPDLVPVAPLLAAADAVPPAEEQAKSVEARAAALKARAARLRGQVLDPQTRDRMQRGVQF